MKSIILAAGQGTRLHPYTLDRPKCMVEIDGISLLERQLEVLSIKSVERIIVVGGYLADCLPSEHINVRINPRYEETNMVWSLYSVLDELEGEIIVSYGDIVYSHYILEELMCSDFDIAVAVDTQWEPYWRARNEDPLEDAETLKLDTEGRILELGQKPESLLDIEGQYMGLIKLSSRGVEVIRDTINTGIETGMLNNVFVERAFMTDLLQEVIDAGHDMHSVPVAGDWVEVDTVSDMKSMLTRERLQNIKTAVQFELRAIL